MWTLRRIKFRKRLQVGGKRWVYVSLLLKITNALACRLKCKHTLQCSIIRHFLLCVSVSEGPTGHVQLFVLNTSSSNRGNHTSFVFLSLYFFFHFYNWIIQKKNRPPRVKELNIYIRMCSYIFVKIHLYIL